MPRITSRRAVRVFLLCGTLAPLGCAEEKGLPDKPAISETPSTATSVLGVRPEKADPAAQEIVTRAVAAHTNGQPKLLETLKAHHLLLRGSGMVLSAQQREVDGYRETWGEWPNRFAFRFVYEVDAERSLPTTGAVVPGAGYLKSPEGTITELPANLQQTFLWDLFALDYTFLPKALTHPEAIFYQPGRGEVNGNPVTTVKAYIPELPTWTLSFDDATSLLVKVEYQGFETAVTSKSVQYSKHLDRDGLKIPGRAEVYNGTMRIWDFRTPDTVERFDSADKIDPKLFEIPR